MIARRDILQIVDGMLRRWLGQSVLALGDEDGAGGVPFATKRGRPFAEGNFSALLEPDDGKHYFDSWKPRGRRIGIGEFALATREGGGNVTLKEGQRLTRLANKRMQLALLTGKLGKNPLQKARTTYRSWQGREMALKIAKDVMDWAESALRAADTRPRGSARRFKRMTTTRDRKTLPYWWEGKFEFGGKSGAFRFPPGRPPLSEAQWVLNYMQRKGLTESDVTPPKVKHGRPGRPL